jgi:hypothetical protein
MWRKERYQRLIDNAWLVSPREQWTLLKDHSSQFGCIEEVTNYLSSESVCRSLCSSQTSRVEVHFVSRSESIMDEWRMLPFVNTSTMPMASGQCDLHSCASASFCSTYGRKSSCFDFIIWIKGHWQMPVVHLPFYHEQIKKIDLDLQLDNQPIITENVFSSSAPL